MSIFRFKHNKLPLNNREIILNYQIPKSKEYKEVSRLIELAEDWKGMNDNIEKQAWLTIAEIAKKNADKVGQIKESIQVELPAVDTR